MQQYRKHFVHNAVDGALLAELDLELLKTELKISPLGHRSVILSELQQLLQNDNGCPHKASASPPRLARGTPLAVRDAAGCAGVCRSSY